MTNRFYVAPKDGGIFEWPVQKPWGPPLPTDARYYGEVLRRVDDALPDAGLTFVMTWSVDSLPKTGKNVVPLVLGDEHCQVPRYTDAVLATLKQYGTRPTWPWDLLSVFGGLRSRDALKHVMLLVERARRRLPKIERESSILTIPLGYYNQVERPFVPLAEREIDVYFAGDLGEASFTLSPKTYARNLLMRSVERLRRERPELKIETASSFSREAHPLGPEEYSERMANAKISLCPRGTNLETWRLFESARVGSIVIHEPLPPYDFYQGFPGLLTRDWSDLPKLIDKSLGAPKDAQTISDRTLGWWRKEASEDALAAKIVAHLNLQMGMGAPGADR